MIATTYARLRLAPPTVALGWSMFIFASALTGCSIRSAPALVLAGAYFPDWLVFAIAVIVIAIAARMVFGLLGLTRSIPFLLCTCLALGILVTGAIDLLWLDR